MKYYTEPSREIPVAAETEVLVVGGGPAGFGAALHAARMGRKTMLIEQYGAVGGVATTGIMSHWTGRQDGGCFEELREKARDCEAEQVINPEKGLTFDSRCGIVNLPVSREVPFLCPFGSYREAITLRQGRNQ